jgi:hypothetical protein
MTGNRMKQALLIVLGSLLACRETTEPDRWETVVSVSPTAPAAGSSATVTLTATNRSRHLQVLVTEGCPQWVVKSGDGSKVAPPPCENDFDRFETRLEPGEGHAFVSTWKIDLPPGTYAISGIANGAENAPVPLTISAAPPVAHRIR